MIAWVGVLRTSGESRRCIDWANGWAYAKMDW
jgi:hypothetical protein